MTVALALVACNVATGQEHVPQLHAGIEFSKYHTYKWIGIEGGAHPIWARGGLLVRLEEETSL